jgi:hypothetical protein
MLAVPSSPVGVLQIDRGSDRLRCLLRLSLRRRSLGLTVARYIRRILAIAAVPNDVVVSKVGKTVQRYLDDRIRRPR